MDAADVTGANLHRIGNDNLQPDGLLGTWWWDSARRGVVGEVDLKFGRFVVFWPRAPGTFCDYAGLPRNACVARLHADWTTNRVRVVLPDDATIATVIPGAGWCEAVDPGTRWLPDGNTPTYPPRECVVSLGDGDAVHVVHDPGGLVHVQLEVAGSLAASPVVPLRAARGPG